MNFSTFFRIAVIFSASLCSLTSRAQSDLCGSPPPVTNESLRAEIDGKARLMTPLLNTSDISGAIEISRTEVFSRYPDADQARSNAYFQYQVCIILMRDQNMTSEQKINALERVRAKFNTQKKFRILLSPIGPHINNRDIGLMNARSGQFKYYVDGNMVRDNALTDAFGTVELNLSEGVHSFKVDAKVRAEDARVDNSCGSNFTINRDAVLSPYIRFKNRRDGTGYIEECGLYDAQNVKRRMDEEHRCGFFGTGSWPDC